MARPIKNNADYFPHDADMRNDTRIKALRRKFNLEGYAIYVMMVELLTDSDYFEFKNDSFSLELVAGDFDIEPEKLTQILQYCFQLDLFQIEAETNTIRCKSLDNRLNPLLSKRERDRSKVITNDNTQSKVKESKVKESRVKKRIVKQTIYNKVFGKSERFITINPDTLHKQIIKVCEDGFQEYFETNKSVISRPEFTKKFFMDRNGKIYKDFSHVWNDLNQFINNQFK